MPIDSQQSSSELIRAHQSSSELIRAHQRSSALIRAHQSSSELISGAHQRRAPSHKISLSSRPIKANQGQSRAPSHKISLSSRPIKANQGQSRPIKANQGQSRPIKGTFPQDLLIFVAQSPQALTKLEAQQRRGCEVVHVKELCHRNELVSVPDEGGNQASSEAIRGHLEAIESNQWQSVATSPRTGGRASRCL